MPQLLSRPGNVFDLGRCKTFDKVAGEGGGGGRSSACLLGKKGGEGGLDRLYTHALTHILHKKEKGDTRLKRKRRGRTNKAWRKLSTLFEKRKKEQGLKIANEEEVFFASSSLRVGCPLKTFSAYGAKEEEEEEPIFRAISFPPLSYPQYPLQGGRRRGEKENRPAVNLIASFFFFPFSLPATPIFPYVQEDGHDFF